MVNETLAQEDADIVGLTQQDAAFLNQLQAFLVSLNPTVLTDSQQSNLQALKDITVKVINALPTTTIVTAPVNVLTNPASNASPTFTGSTIATPATSPEVVPNPTSTTR